MSYVLDDREKIFLDNAIDNFIITEDKLDLTGTSISPYNLRYALHDKGFKEEYFDNNSSDYWIRFSYEDSNFIMYFNAESFELILERERT